ncbi:hypothetical protein MTO96_029842 [Rhipicephalus appendiculatus]
MVKEELSDDGENSNHKSSKSSKRDAEESPSQEDGSSKPKKPKFKDDEKGREYECKLCDSKFFTLGQYSCHIQSYEHRKRTVLQTADKAFSEAPQYRGGREGDLPPGLSGRKVVHCKVCNVFTNSAKQLAEHLNGGRHKQICFKFNVPITTLELTSDDVATLEGTRLKGDKLMCKCCSVELNSMEQYTLHMASNKHKLVMARKPVRPDRNIKRALRPYYKRKMDEEKKEKSDAKAENDEDEEKNEQKDKSKDKEKDKQKDKSKDKEKDKHKDKSKDKEDKKDKEEDKVSDSSEADKSVSSTKVRNKYQLNLLDELSEQPTLRNELDFIRSHRPMKDKKTFPKPVPYMCDICHVFGKSAFELNESKDDDKPTEVKDSEDKKPKNPQLYCDVCQLLLPSLGTKIQVSNMAQLASRILLSSVKRQCHECVA